jgi:hypothetical protein
LILVEAKAHAGELSLSGKELRCDASQNSRDNHAQIEKAIAEANNALERVLPGWSLSRDNRYQISNRFAWAWKCASLGYPVILIFLGFLNAVEMRDQGPPFRNAGEWEKFIRQSTNEIVPAAAWGNRIPVGSSFLLPLIKSMSVAL